jgi:uncharacterized membrane-anchored protein YhcB (DUF1043 family)
LESFEKICVEYFGIGGRVRKYRDETTRTKERVAKNINRAVRKLKEYDNKTYQHFNKALRPINSFSQSYKPDRDITWLT